MTERKFTDEEIIKALECCYTNDSNDCYKCPYTAESTAEMFCDKKLQKDALDLINRQKEEIEIIKETTAEIRYEAVKEFAEYLKKYYRHIDKTAGALIEYTIDKKVEQFLGGDASGARTENEN